jgi:protein gp37
MADTHIEWSEVVWNPTTGCDRVSDLWIKEFPAVVPT